MRRNVVAASAEQILVGITFFVIYGVLVRRVGPEGVGVLSLVLVLSSIGSLANIGFGSALLRFVPMYEGRRDREMSVLAIESAVICSALFYGVLLALIYYPFQLLVTAQVGPSHAADVRDMMLPATINVLAMGIGAVTMAGLSAVLRNDLRSYANVGGAILCLGFVFLGTRDYGAVAAFWGLAAQAVFTLLATWIMLCRELPELHLLPRRVSRKVAGELIKFGSKLQLQSLLVMALEPVSRLLVGHFGTLSDVTYFSMAARLVMQVRSMIYSGAQPVLSAFGYLREHDPAQLQALYARFSSVIGLISIITLSGTVAAAPFIGEIWIGNRIPSFELYVAVQALGWLSVTVILGSYFNAYSLGYLRYNVGSHVAMALANIVLGPILGWLFGPIGVVVAFSLSLLLAGLIMGIGNARLSAEPHAFTFWAEIPTLLLACLAAAGSIAAYHWARLSWPPLTGGVISGALWALIVGPVLLFHPGRRDLRELLRWRRVAAAEGISS